MSSQNIINLKNGSPSSTERVYQNQEGLLVQIPSRSRRGRKSSRKSSHPLRDIRLSRGLTLEELSEISELSPSYLSRLESGTRRLNVDTIDRLSKALKCTPSDLLVTGERWGQIQAGVYTTPRPQTLALCESKEPLTSTNKLPIYGTSTNNGTINFSTNIGFTTCPADLAGIPGSFALRISDDILPPRYRKGDLVFIHPGRPLSPFEAVVIITTDQKIILGEFVAWRLTSDVKKFFNMPNNSNKVGTQEQYAIELKPYNPINAKSSQSGENIILHPQYIQSAARIVGRDEN
ncbi:MAG: helix-turn-helix domain-containing protein [Alphaproteobacteria bacterium]|nr:helix-turn-helix domain-containing protein [Alphaproteobacteria bacterium]